MEAAQSFLKKLKDKRVDQLLLEKGIKSSQIFYSPILIWFVFLFLVPGIIGLSLLGYFLFVGGPNVYLAGLFLLTSYLIAAYLNNSFAINGDKFYVINPNFPFQKLLEFELTKIHVVRIDKAKWGILFYLFGFFGRNYVEVETAKGRFRFFCSGLELDLFEENLTDLTLDDLWLSLEEKEIPVECKLG
ncbi:MAG: hypothetical protein R8P61_04990 [Bacteroidia bacterium]|nr:hypothetical protein [Bacteroidia bacterium]